MRLFKDRDKERADGVLTLSVLSMMVLLLLFAFSVGITNSITNKSEYSDVNQTATQNSIAKVEKNGYLGAKSVEYYLTDVKTTLLDRIDKNVLPDPRAAKCEGTRDNVRVKIVLKEQRENKASTRQRLVYDGPLALAPSLSGSERQAVESLALSLSQRGSKWRVLEATLSVDSPNPVPTFGLKPCSKYEVFSSAVAFGHNKDL